MLKRILRENKNKQVFPHLNMKSISNKFELCEQVKDNMIKFLIDVFFLAFFDDFDSDFFLFIFLIVMKMVVELCYRYIIEYVVKCAALEGIYVECNLRNRK